MRSRVLLGLLGVCGVVSIACTSLLGDFSIGAVDGSPGDSGSNDSPNDSPAADAADGSSVVKLTCVESKQAGHVHLGDVYIGSNNGDAHVWLFTYQANNNTYAHALVQGDLQTDSGNYIKVIHTFTFRTGSGGTTAVDAPLTGMQLESVRRYKSSAGSGIAALMFDYSNEVFWITTMADDSNDAGSPVWGDAFPVPGAAFPQGTCRLVGAFEPIDPANHDYVVAATYNTGSCTGAPVLAVNRTSTTNGFVSLPGFATPDGGAAQGYDLGDDAITSDGTSFYLMVTLGGGGGPATGASPVIYKDLFSGSPTQTPLKLAAPSHILYPLGMRASSATPTNLDMGFLGGDIQTQVGLFVGHTPFSNLANVTPETDLSSVFASLPELPVNSGAAHWDDIPGLAAPNLLAASAPPTGGANLWWFDESGNVRARQTGSSALFPGETIGAIDVSAAQAFNIFGNLEVAFIEPADGGTNNYSVYASEIDCSQ